VNQRKSRTSILSDEVRKSAPRTLQSGESGQEIADNDSDELVDGPYCRAQQPSAGNSQMDETISAHLKKISSQLQLVVKTQEEHLKKIKHLEDIVNSKPVTPSKIDPFLLRIVRDIKKSDDSLKFHLNEPITSNSNKILVKRLTGMIYQQKKQSYSWADVESAVRSNYRSSKALARRSQSPATMSRKRRYARKNRKLQARTLSVKELKRKNVINDNFIISYEECSSEYSSDEDGLVIQPVVNRDPAISEVLRIVDKATEERMLNIGALRKKKRKRKELFPSN